MVAGLVSGRARPNDPLETWCEAKVEGVCRGRATLRHHRQGRTPIPGIDVDDRDHTLDLCDPCHRHIHNHPAQSYERGWMIRRVL